jgi:hypothetical protein
VILIVTIAVLATSSFIGQRRRKRLGQVG